MLLYLRSVNVPRERFVVSDRMHDYDIKSRTEYYLINPFCVDGFVFLGCLQVLGYDFLASLPVMVQ